MSLPFAHSDRTLEHPADNDSMEVLGALNVLLEDTAFRVSARNKRFLRYVVEETLAGRGHRLKAYTIAVDVFGRSASFDGASDPIVRIEASRLRAALSKYYSSPIVDPGLRIWLPKGTYAPVFERVRSAINVGFSADDLPVRAEKSPPLSGPPAVLEASRKTADLPYSQVDQGPTRSASLASWLVRTVFPWRRKPIVDDPILVVDVIAPLIDDEPTRLLARTFSQTLVSALSQYDGISVSRLTSHDTTAVTRLLKANPQRRIFRLSSEINVAQDNVRLWWSLSDLRTTEVYRSGREEGPWRSISRGLVEVEIAERVAATIAHSTGSVKTIMARGFSDPFAPGYPAILRAQSYILNLDPEIFSRSRESLERTVELAPDYAEAWAYLAYIYASETRQGPPLNRSFNESIELAKQAAAKAVNLAQFSSLTQFALMIVKFQDGDDRGFESASETCLYMSPSDPKVLIAVGNRRWAIGRWAEGTAMIRRAIEISGIAGPADELALALDAYRREDYFEAQAISRRIASNVHTAAMILAASYGQLGEAESAKPYVHRLLQLRPHFALEMRTEFRNFRTGYLADHFADGLRKAGLNVSDQVIPKDQSLSSVR